MNASLQGLLCHFQDPVCCRLALVPLFLPFDGAAQGKTVTKCGGDNHLHSLIAYDKAGRKMKQESHHGTGNFVK